MDYNSANSGDLNAIDTADGSVVSFVQSKTETGSGCTLTTGHTYVFVLGSVMAPVPSQASLVSVQLYWAAAVAGTITVETCNFPKYGGTGDPRTGAVDVSDYTTTAGLWQLQNPSTAYVPVAGTGNTVSNMTVTAGGTNAGGCEFDLGNLGARRVRVKVVATTGGLVRCNVHGKAAR